MKSKVIGNWPAKNMQRGAIYLVVPRFYFGVVERRLLFRRYLRNRAINHAAASTGIKMMTLETSPARIASFKLTVLLGMVVGGTTATKITPKISGITRPALQELAQRYIRISNACT